jgi:hypothetical protein
LRRAIATLGIFAALTLASCKKSPAATGSPKASCRVATSAEDLYRLQERVQRGENVCPELSAPNIRVMREAVHLDGEPLSGSVPAALTSRFEPLYEKLKLGRELWLQIHPGETFRPSTAINVDPGVTALAGASIVRTAALAGYPEVELRSKELILRFSYAFPSREAQPKQRPEPPSAPWGKVDDTPPAETPQEVLVLFPRADGKVNARFRGRATSRLGLSRTVPGAELAALLTKECETSPSSCVDRVVVEVGETSFHDAMKLGDSALKAHPLAGRALAIGFEQANPARENESSPPPTGADAEAPEKRGASKSKVHIGALSVKGPLPRAAVETVIRQNAERWLVCYERALAKNPTLEGRVSMRFVIGRDGVPANTQNGGSDLPDVEVVRCVALEYGKLRFPPPEGDVVTVVSPLLFAPSER